jgi:hypothetical protein
MEALVRDLSNSSALSSGYAATLIETEGDRASFYTAAGGS